MSTKWTLYCVFRAASVSEPFLCAKVRITAEPYHGRLRPWYNVHEVDIILRLSRGEYERALQCAKVRTEGVSHNVAALRLYYIM